MKWSTSRRMDTGLIEHGCEHGVGHPNGASAIRVAYHCINDPLYYGKGNLRDESRAWSIHGCCGVCCTRPDFPGNVFNNLTYAFNLYVDKGLEDHLRGINRPIFDRLQTIKKYDDINEPIVERERQAYMDLKKLKALLLNTWQDKQYEDDYRIGAEFMFWPLKQLVFDNICPPIGNGYWEYYNKYAPDTHKVR